MPGPPKQLVESLSNAVAALDEAKVPKDLREVAFKAALAGLNIKSENGDETPLAVPTPSGDAGGSADHFGKIAKKLKVDAAAVERVFDFDDGDVHLLIGHTDLNSTRSEAQKEVALLVVAARQGAGLEDWTSTEEVRNAANDLGVYDKAFASRVETLKGGRMRMRGKGRSRELKMNQPGFEEAAALVSRLVETAK
jgi:hypothetical protein